MLRREGGKLKVNRRFHIASALAYTYLYGLAMKILALAENKNSTARNKSELFFS